MSEMKEGFQKLPSGREAATKVLQKQIQKWLHSKDRGVLVLRGFRSEQQAAGTAEQISKYISTLSVRNAEPIECGSGQNAMGWFVQLRKAGRIDH